MAEEFGKTANDGQTEAEALAAITLGIADLVELVEDLFGLLRRDADAGVPYLDAPMLPVPPHPDQDAAGLGIADGVVDQVAQYPFEQQCIAACQRFAPANTQIQALRLCLGLEIDAQALQQGVQGEGFDLRADRPGIDLGDVEQFVEQRLERIHRGIDAADHVAHFFIMRLVGQRRGEEPHRMQGLAQVMAGGGKELRLGPTRQFGRIARLLQLRILDGKLLRHGFVLEAAAQRLGEELVVFASEGQDAERDGRANERENDMEPVAFERVAYHDRQQRRKDEYVERGNVRGDQGGCASGHAENQDGHDGQMQRRVGGGHQ